MTKNPGSYTIVRLTDGTNFYKASGGTGGGTLTIDGDAFVAATSEGRPIMAARDDSAPALLAENTQGTLRATEYRALHVNLRTVAGVEIAPLTDAQLRDSAVAVSAATLPLPADAATETTLGTRASETTLGAVRDRLPPLLDADGGLKVHVQHTVPVSGPFLTDTELRASAVTVSGPLTDTELRASAFAVNVESVVPAPWDHARVDPLTTATVAGASTALKYGVRVVADEANAGPVYVGKADVTAGTAAATDGIPLPAGTSEFFRVANLADLYFIASAAGRKVYLLWS